jgi:nucleotide-binding universal stress UspA family protein
MDDRLGIVVGIDGSEGSARALRWAANESERHRLPLTVVHVCSWALNEVPLPHPVVEDGHRRAQELIERMTADLRAQRRHAPVESRVVNDHAVPGLVAFSEAADMIVVGSHGGHSVLGMPIGSVANGVAAHAACPTVVVRPQCITNADARVIVGVDGSPANQAAVAFAFQEALAHGTTLQAILCWRGERGALQTETAAEAQLAEALAPWQEKYPNVDVMAHVSLRAARPGLIGASRDASLMIVGSRGYGGFRGLLMGSVSSALVQHADCPVAVVRSESIEPEIG